MSRYQKLTIEDLELKGKKVLIRVDFNVPLDEGKITDDTRIVRALPTISYIIQRGGHVILMSHLGDPDGKVDSNLSLTPVAKRLENLLGQKVTMVNDCLGDRVKKVVAEMKEKEVVLLENLRFYSGEKENDNSFAKELANLCDIYVNDAFGTAHRNHASIVGITKFVKVSAAGLLMKKEIDYLHKILNNPTRPFVAIIGGIKASTKIEIISNLLRRVDILIIGGGTSYTFLKALGRKVGKSEVANDKIEVAREILITGLRMNIPILLPIDHVIAKSVSSDAKVQVVPQGCITDEFEGVDIGPATIQIFTSILKEAKSIVWNGPMGAFELEKFSKGTEAIAKALSESNATTIVGGGDSTSAIEKLGIAEKITHVSTGGSACLGFLAGKTLPGIAALTNKKTG
jgi:3-phosphoglycerate kinase